MNHTFITESAGVFRQQKSLSERALEQVDDAHFFAAFDNEANSLAVLVKHMAGNLRSRWTDFLETDGEKPDRNRDGEFIITDADTRASLMNAWEAGWQTCLSSIESLTESDLERTVRIRGEEHGVTGAIQRALAHAAQHAGQIIFLAKHYAAEKWTTLSIPRGQSVSFTSASKARRM